MDEPIYQFQGKYRFLSNFWPVTVTLPDDELNYPSLEHAYQAAKTTDRTKRLEIWAAKTPGQAKRLGKTAKLRPNWDAMRVDLMRDLVMQKFSCDPVLKQSLLQTGDAELIEGNSWGDRFWGRVNDGRGTGENWLGRLLMETRDWLRREDDYDSDFAR